MCVNSGACRRAGQFVCLDHPTCSPSTLQCESAQVVDLYTSWCVRHALSIPSSEGVGGETLKLRQG